MFSILIFLIMLFALSLVIFSSDQYVVRTKQRLHKLSRYSMKKREEYANSETELLMKQAGIPFSLYQYQIARITIFLSLAVIMLVQIIANKSVNYLFISLVVFGFIFSSPNERVLNITSPFKKVIDLMQSNKRTRYNEELYLAISQLRNSFKVYGKKAPSAIEMFEEITQYTDVLKPVFQRLISLWMLNETEKAVGYFEKEIQTSEAKKLGQTFLKLDSLNPIEFDEQLLTFQQIYRSKRETERRKKDELKSYILFGAVLATAMVILINFIVVGFLIDILMQTSTLY